MRKAKIDKNGVLHFQRAGKMKETRCPNAEFAVYCGDFCPLFSEPHLIGDGRGSIRLCNHVEKYFDEFIDERVKE